MIVSRAEKEENPLPVAGIGGLEHTLLDDDGEDEAPAYGAPPNVMASWITKVSSADRLPIGTFNVDVSAAMLPPGAQKTSSSSSSGMGGGHGGAAPTAAGRQRRLPELPGVGPATHTSSSSSPLARSTLPSLHSSPMLIKKWMQIVRNTMMMHVANDGKGRFITFICGGMRHVTFEKTVRKYPGTLITDILLEDDARRVRSHTFTVHDRHVLALVEILNIYRTGAICWAPPNIPKETWFTELKHFRIHKAGSCLMGSDLVDEMDKAITRFGSGSLHEAAAEGDPALSKEDPKTGLSLLLFSLLEDPQSVPGFVFSTISMSLIILSVTMVCIETLPDLQRDHSVDKTFAAIDFAIVLFFTFDYFGRWHLAHFRIRWPYTPFNIIDIFTIVPSYFTFFGGIAGQEATYKSLKFFRVLRVLRIFKLGRYLPGLQVLVRTAVGCREELGLLFFCFSVFVLIFSSLLYFAEADAEQPFDIPFSSIPQTLWWAIVTMTSVGFGDMVPVTVWGKLFGSCAAVSGVILIALPISVISTTFSTEFKVFTYKLKAKERRIQAQLAKTRELVLEGALSSNCVLASTSMNSSHAPDYAANKNERVAGEHRSKLQAEDEVVDLRIVQRGGMLRGERPDERLSQAEAEAIALKISRRGGMIVRPPSQQFGRRTSSVVTSGR